MIIFLPSAGRWDTDSVDAGSRGGMNSNKDDRSPDLGPGGIRGQVRRGPSQGHHGGGGPRRGDVSGAQVERMEHKAAARYDEGRKPAPPPPPVTPHFMDVGHNHNNVQPPSRSSSFYSAK